MKKIKILGGILSVFVLFSCKNKSEQDSQTNDVLVKSEQVSSKADSIVTEVKDSLASDFDSAGKSIEQTIENIEKGQEQLQQKVDESIKKASK